MAYFQIIYSYDPTQNETMDRIRPDHRAFLGRLKDEGVNIASGPLGGGDPAALLIFEAESADEVEARLDEDPFKKAGVILSRSVRPWSPVIKVF